jgi:hypothetical protein
MSAHIPIGSCCSRPRFNAAGGIDDCASVFELNGNSLINVVRKVDPTAATLVGGILAALAVVYVFTLMLL